MIVKNVPINEAIGHILLHNQADSNGRRILKKGHLLTTPDIETLQTLEKSTIYVAIIEAGDIAENEAAHRLGQYLKHDYLNVSTATTGRVNLIATKAGMLNVNYDILQTFNNIPGITLATKLHNSQVQSKTLVGTIKIIPYSVPETDLTTAETILRENPSLIKINPFSMRKATLITTGSDNAREKVINGFTPALQNRLETYGVELVSGPYVSENVEEICGAIQQALDNQAEMILIAGETSIMDIDDITPQAIVTAGGELIHHGVPVEPGNLLLLAYHGQTPIVGTPGCARSKKYNVVDMVLPRLATGEHLTRQDLIALGHGGYL